MDLEFPQLSATRPKASSLASGPCHPCFSPPPHTDAHPRHCSRCYFSWKTHEGQCGAGLRGPELRPTLPLHCPCELGDSQNWVRNTGLFHEWRIQKWERVAIRVLCELVKCYILNATIPCKNKCFTEPNRNANVSSSLLLLSKVCIA